MITQGIIVGCDKKQQWLLPWFWDHYSNHNCYPIAFMDFGMDAKVRSWCEERGLCLLVPEFSLLPVSRDIAKDWESREGNEFWRSRSVWFSKVRACNLCPFDEGIWLDLDCEVKGPLDPLFHLLGFGPEFAIAPEHPIFQQNLRERNRLLPGHISYSSGVMAFKKQANVLSLWLEESMKNNHLHKGDQDALTHVINTCRPEFTEIPLEYNWPITRGDNKEAIILHYDSGPGKIQILQTLKREIAPLVKAFSI